MTSVKVALELRVLDGIHAGARTDAWDGMLLGTDHTADIVLAGLDDAQELAKLHLAPEGRWLLWPADQSPDVAALAQAPLLGEPAVWGRIALCVSATDADWQDPSTVQIAQLDIASTATATLSDTTPSPPLAPDEPETIAVMPSSPAPAMADSRGGWTSRLQRSPMALASLALVVLGAGLTLAWFRHGSAPAALNNAVAATHKNDTPLLQTPAQTNSQRQAIALLIAQVSPTLRLQLTSQADGRVRVNGWVDSVAQFDQLAENLAKQRPVPLLQLHVATELRDELRARLGPEYASLDFVPDGPGQLRVSGTINTTEKREEVLTSLRSALPADLQLVDGLNVFGQLAAQVQTALVAAGFANAHARWENDRMVTTLSLSANDRPELEKALLALVKRFPGLPLQVKVDTSVPIQAGSKVAPFAIRSVVSGPMPYLVLANGSKLLLGGSHAGWRLEAIEPNTLVFNGTRRLSVAR